MRSCCSRLGIQISQIIFGIAIAGTTYTIYSDTDQKGTFGTAVATGVVGTTWSGITPDAKKNL